MDKTLKKELFSWLGNTLKSNTFDFVVCVERKATAVIRMYLDFYDVSEKILSWDNILSSDALKYLPPGYLDGKNVLIFNEMIHEGSSTLMTLRNVLRNSNNVARVEAAAFACANGFPKKQWLKNWIDAGGAPGAPHYVYEFGVSKIRYQRLWQSIVNMLRSSGALLLDTEHIETTFTLKMSIREFVKALCAVGLPIEYENDDSTWPIGVTVREPILANLEGLQSLLPQGIDLNATEPKKLRFVRRNNNEFAAIAIWYPPLALQSAEKYIETGLLPSYISSAVSQCPMETRAEFIFHLSSLIASLEMLKATWAALSPLIKKGKIILNTPKGYLLPGEPLGHLRSLYPMLQFDSLESELQAAVSAYKDVETVHEVRKIQKGLTNQKERCAPVFVDLKTRSRAARDILVELIEEVTPIGIDEEWIADWDVPPRSLPFSWQQFWKAGQRIGVDENVRSVAMDYAIDNAILKTTHHVIERNGEKFIIRGYLPDSEFAHKALLRLALGGEILNFD